MTTTPPARPGSETDDSVYSNFDHELETEVVEQLESNPNLFCAQHAAYNFCGYIWFDGERWREDVMRYGQTVDHIIANTIEELITEANERYGTE